MRRLIAIAYSRDNGMQRIAQIRHYLKEKGCYLLLSIAFAMRKECLYDFLRSTLGDKKVARASSRTTVTRDCKLHLQVVQMTSLFSSFQARISMTSAGSPSSEASVASLGDPDGSSADLPNGSTTVPPSLPSPQGIRMRPRSSGGFHNFLWLNRGHG